MILFKRLSPYAHVPTYHSEGAVGMDLHAALPPGAFVDIEAGRHALVPLGFSAEIPEDYWVLIAARSGLAVKHGITCLCGVVDPDFRGEWHVCLFNGGTKPFHIVEGDRIAQAVVHFRSPMRFVETKEELTYTNRGDGGWGSTGV
jgi:dUTP pyrophosphatase